MPTLVGLLVDVSASMQTSLRNDTKETLSRLDGWTEALRRAAQKSHAEVSEKPSETPSIRVFALAFGTRRIGPVIDLLTLLSLRDKHGDSGPAEPRSLRGRPLDDPYAELARLAMHHGKEGWALWARKHLDWRQATTLLANVQNSPRVQREIASSLPNLSEKEFEVADAHNWRKLITGGPLYAYRAFRLWLKAELSGFRAKTREAERMVRTVASRRMTFADLLEERLKAAGSTMLTVGELAGILSRLARAGSVDSELGEFLYGVTPLTAAVHGAAQRFRAERIATRWGLGGREVAKPMARWSLGEWLIAARAAVRAFPGAVRAAGRATLSAMVKAVFRIAQAGPPRVRAYVRAAVRLMLWRKITRTRRSAARGASEILFIISDGESTDGEPLAEIASLRRAGATIVSCYIGPVDVVERVRSLPAAASPSWAPGAQQLFTFASPVPYGRHRDYLQEKGWRIPAGARLFIQANHSDVLTEVAELLLRP
ncbi:hypothetical protein AB0J80_27650 [Actinoplanes sp. NPDC049548]|uniref:hypothetical protein n=1 Tax=Actinoplanes sp. NPDC049548 TaxID=3155152 RepID=UPI00342BE2B7